MSYHKGLQRYHTERQRNTADQIWNALFRMQTEETVVLKKGFKWTKLNWAREAQINVNTLCKKLENGEFIHSEAHEAFDEGPAGIPRTRRESQARIASLQANETRLLEIIRQRDIELSNRDAKIAELLARLGNRTGTN